MRVRLLRIISTLSLVLCASTLVLWVAGMWRIDGVAYNSATHSWQYSTGRGGVTAERYGSGFSELEIYDAWYTFSLTGEDLAHLDEVPPRGRSLLGFAWHYETQPAGGGMTSTAWLVRVPYWFIVLMTAIPPPLWLRATRARRRRRASQQCLTCGYDLRATPERCPECGAGTA